MERLKQLRRIPEALDFARLSHIELINAFGEVHELTADSHYDIGTLHEV